MAQSTSEDISATVTSIRQHWSKTNSPNSPKILDEVIIKDTLGACHSAPSARARRLGRAAHTPDALALSVQVRARSAASG